LIGLEQRFIERRSGLREGSGGEDRDGEQKAFGEMEMGHK
jgi:hypothetical protein